MNQSVGPGAVDASGVSVALRRGPGGPVLARESVTPADLLDARCEAWRELCLRRGRLELGMSDLDLRLVPRAGESGGGTITGFSLVIDSPVGEGATGRCDFSIHALEPVARRAEARLVRSGILAAGDTFHYGLEVDAVEVSPPVEDAGPALFDVTFKNPPVRYMQVPLAPLLDEARTEGGHRPDAFPVFYTEEAREKAERFSRRGAAGDPHFESGCVLVGPVCGCPDTGEFFVVITDVFEVTDAESSLVSLEYSGKSWVRIQAVVKARQQVEPAVRVLGQAHGHNYLPNNGTVCEKCPTLPVCNVSNVFASPDDAAWTRAVFSKQPWSLCHIFGLTARGDKEQGLFTQHDARLQPRQFYVIAGFDPWNHPSLNVEQ